MPVSVWVHTSTTECPKSHDVNQDLSPSITTETHPTIVRCKEPGIEAGMVTQLMSVMRAGDVNALRSSRKREHGAPGGW